MGAEAQDADPQRVAAAQPRAREEHPPPRVDPAQQLRPEPIGVVRRRRAGGRPRPRAAARRASRTAGRPRSSSYAHRASAELLGELLAEGGDAVELQRQPEAQAAEVARQLGREVGEAERALVRSRPGRSSRVSRWARASALAVAHEQRPEAVGQEEPLVGVERDRVALLDPAQQRLAARREAEEAAVRGVGVGPQAVLARDRGRPRAAGRRRRCSSCRRWRRRGTAAGPRARSSRTASSSAVGTSRKPRVRRERAQARPREAGEARRLRDAVVRLLGEVDRRRPGSPRRAARGARPRSRRSSRATRRR